MKKFKTIIAMFVILLATVTLSACSCNFSEKTVALTGFSIADADGNEDKDIDIFKGKEFIINYKILPLDASVTTVNVKITDKDNEAIIKDGVVSTNTFSKTSGPNGSFLFKAIGEGTVVLIFNTTEKNIICKKTVNVFDEAHRVPLDNVSNISYNYDSKKLIWDKQVINKGLIGYDVSIQKNTEVAKVFRTTSNEYVGNIGEQVQFDKDVKYTIKIKAIGDGFLYNSSEQYSAEYKFCLISQPIISSFAEGVLVLQDNLDSFVSEYEILLEDENKTIITISSTTKITDIKNTSLYKTANKISAHVFAHKVRAGYEVNSKDYNIIDGVEYIKSTASETKSVTKLSKVSDLTATRNTKGTINILNTPVNDAFTDGEISFIGLTNSLRTEVSYEIILSTTTGFTYKKIITTDKNLPTDNKFSFTLDSNIKLTNEQHVEKSLDDEVFDVVVKVIGTQSNVYTVSSENSSIRIQKPKALITSDVNKTVNTDEDSYKIGFNNVAFDKYELYIKTPTNKIIKSNIVKNEHFELNSALLNDGEGDYIVFARGIVPDSNLNTDPMLMNSKISEVFNYTKLQAPQITEVNNKGNVKFIFTPPQNLAVNYFFKLNLEDATVDNKKLYKIAPTQNTYNIFDSALTSNDIVKGKVYNLQLMIRSSSNANIFINSNFSNIYKIIKLNAPTNIALQNNKLIWTNGEAININAVAYTFSNTVTLNNTTSKLNYEKEVLINNESDLFPAIASSNIFKIQTLGNNYGVIDSDIITSSIDRNNMPANILVKDGKLQWDNVEGADYIMSVYNKVGAEKLNLVEIPIPAMATGSLIATFDFSGIDLTTTKAITLKVNTLDKFQSVYSNELFIKKLSKPTNILYKFDATSQSFKLEWDVVSNASNYQVVLNAPSSGVFTAVGNTNIDTNFTDISNKFIESGAYAIKVIANGSLNTSNTDLNSPAYLTSEFSDEIKIYKMATPSLSISNTGILNWEFTPIAGMGQFEGFNISYSLTGLNAFTTIFKTSSETSADLGLEILAAGDYDIKIQAIRKKIETGVSNIDVLNSDESTLLKTSKLQKISNLGTANGLIIFNGNVINEQNLALDKYFIYRKINDGKFTLIDNSLYRHEIADKVYSGEKYSLSRRDGNTILLEFTDLLLDTKYEIKIVPIAPNGIKGIESDIFAFYKLKAVKSTLQYLTDDYINLIFTSSNKDFTFKVSSIDSTGGKTSETFEIDRSNNLLSTKGREVPFTDNSDHSIRTYSLFTDLFDFNQRVFTMTDFNGSNINLTKDNKSKTISWSVTTTSKVDPLTSKTIFVDPHSSYSLSGTSSAPFVYSLFLEVGDNNTLIIRSFNLMFEEIKEATVTTGRKYYYPLKSVMANGAFSFDVTAIGNTTTSSIGYLNSDISNINHIIKLNNNAINPENILADKNKVIRIENRVLPNKEKSDHLIWGEYLKTSLNDLEKPTGILLKFYKKDDLGNKTLYGTKLTTLSELELSSKTLFSEGNLELTNGSYEIILQQIGNIVDGVLTYDNIILNSDTTCLLDIERLESPVVYLEKGVIKWNAIVGGNYDLYFNNELVAEGLEVNEYKTKVNSSLPIDITVICRASGKIASKPSAKFVGTKLADITLTIGRIGNLTDGQAGLYFNNVDKASGYEIYSKNSADKDYKLFLEIGKTSNNTVCVPLPTDLLPESYSFIVRAIGGSSSPTPNVNSDRLFNESNAVSISYVANVSNIVVDNGIIKWDKINSASIYTISYTYKIGADIFTGSIFTSNVEMYDFSKESLNNNSALSEYTLTITAVGAVIADAGNVIVSRKIEDTNSITVIKQNLATDFRIENGEIAFDISMSNLLNYKNLCKYTDSIEDITKVINGITVDEAILQKYLFFKNISISLNGNKTDVVISGLKADVNKVTLYYALPNPEGTYSISIAMCGNKSDAKLNIIGILNSNNILVAGGAGNTLLAYKPMPPKNPVLEGTEVLYSSIVDGKLVFNSSSYVKKSGETLSTIRIFNYKVLAIDPKEKVIINEFNFLEKDLLTGFQFSVDLSTLVNPLLPNTLYHISVIAMGTSNSSTMGVGDIILNSDAHSYNELTFLTEPDTFRLEDGVFKWAIRENAVKHTLSIYGVKNVQKRKIEAYSTFDSLDTSVDQEALIGKIDILPEDKSGTFNFVDFKFTAGQLNDKYINAENLKLLPGIYKFRITAVGNGTTIISSLPKTTITSELLKPVSNIIVGTDAFSGKFVWDKVETSNNGILNNYCVSVVVVKSANTSEVEGKSDEYPLMGSNSYSLNDSAFANDIKFKVVSNIKFGLHVRAKGDSVRYLDGDSSQSLFYSRMETPPTIEVRSDGFIAWGKVIENGFYEINITNSFGNTVSLRNNTNIYSLNIADYPAGTYTVKVKTLANDEIVLSNRKLDSNFTNTIKVTKVPAPNIRIEDGVLVWNTDSFNTLGYEMSPSYVILYKKNIGDENYKVLGLKNDEYIEDKDAQSNILGFTVPREIANLSILENKAYVGGDYKTSIKFKGNPSVINDDKTYYLPTDPTICSAKKLLTPNSPTYGVSSDTKQNYITWNVVTYLQDGVKKPIYNYRVKVELFKLDGKVDLSATQYFMNASIKTVGNEALKPALFYSVIVDGYNPNIDYTYSFSINSIMDNWIKNGYIGANFYVQAMGSIDSTLGGEGLINSSYSDAFTIALPEAPIKFSTNGFGTINWEMPSTLQGYAFDIYVDEVYTITENYIYDETKTEVLNRQAVQLLVEKGNRKVSTEINIADAIKFDKLHNIVNVVINDFKLLTIKDGKTPTSYKLDQVATSYKIKMKSLVRADGSVDLNAVNLESKYSALFVGVESFKVYNAGDGSLQNPYVITNEREFFNINYYPDKSFKLMNNIAFTYNTKEWESGVYKEEINKLLIQGITPIGFINNEKLYLNGISDFTGIFDGNNKNITNIRYRSTNVSIGINSYNSIGSLFGTNKGLIKNLNIEYSNTDSLNVYNIGSVVAFNNGGTIENIKIGGKLSVNLGTILNGTLATYGGAVLYNKGTSLISGVINNAEVKFLGNGSTYPELLIGGIVYENTADAIVTKCGVNGIFSACSIGGIAFNNSGNISKCYNKANMILSDNGNNAIELRLGGIVTNNNGENKSISFSYTNLTGKMISVVKNSNKTITIGGIIGVTTKACTVSQCYAVIGYTSTGVSGTDNIRLLIGADTNNNATYINDYQEAINNSAIINANVSGLGIVSDIKTILNPSDAMVERNYMLDGVNYLKLNWEV